ncbi:MAG: hypothetical protein IGR76_07955 [Synechococcales cyanobacterium T60_A2020_003]|nr:hypothetical protein [Synechococcales cyanobacterium T60_A2020_003]
MPHSLLSPPSEHASESIPFVDDGWDRPRSPAHLPPISPKPNLDLPRAIAEGLRWLAGATLLRMVVEATFLQSPLWSLSGLMGLALLLAPAAMGLALSHYYPSMRMVVAYRLMFVMIGLLLGGRV